MSTLQLKPTHAPVKAYYETLPRFGRLDFDNEGNLRRSFEALLEKCARQFDWIVIPHYPQRSTSPSRRCRVLDAFNLPRGYWEAKDTKDDLEAEMLKKCEAGYPRTNILFQSPARAILFQNGRIEFNSSIEEPVTLVDVLRSFFEWREPHLEHWDRAVAEFSERIPDIAQGAMRLIEAARKTNKVFIERFAAFAEVCRESINPDLKDEAVEEMRVQHLLTERIFDNPEFTRRRNRESHRLAHEQAHQPGRFSQNARSLLQSHRRGRFGNRKLFAETSLLNSVYEKFFQGVNPKQADTASSISVVHRGLHDPQCRRGAQRGVR